MLIQENVREAGKWDIIVCGGGVAGIAAAVSAARRGKKTLIIEKSINFGGLATNGLVNYFVPMCNGRGKQIIFGMADEMLKMSWDVSWTNTKESWIQNYPEKEGRLDGNYSPTIFSLALADMLKKAGVEIFLDTLLSGAVVEDGVIKGIITDSKSGREYLAADFFIDATGDADLLVAAGVPTRTGKNYFTYYALGMNFDTMKRAIDNGKIGNAYRWYMGGRANLYGGGHPEGKKLYSGTTREEVTEFILDNQQILFESIKGLDKDGFDLTVLPSMPQFRETRCMDADELFSEKDAYVHKTDSVCAINDFDRKDFLYEVSYKSMVKSGFDNVMAVGRAAGATGYGWDVLRVIPPAILTGQAAGNACAIALEDGVGVHGVDISKLQRLLESQNVTIHFDDDLVPTDKEIIEKGEDNGHI